jgi:hypothetical protein
LTNPDTEYDNWRRSRGKEIAGSGGYAFAKLTEQEEIKASLGVPQIFLGNIGRLNEDRFTRYYCNKCKKEYTGCPAITYENPTSRRECGGR